MILTPEHIKFFRSSLKADAIVLRHGKGQAVEPAYNKTDICLRFECADPKCKCGVGSFDTLTIDSGITDFGSNVRADWYGAEVINHYKYSFSEWAALVELLKVGDDLIVRWYVSNDSLAMKEAGWIEDYVKFEITRGKKALGVTVSRRLSNVNTPFRMLKHVEYSLRA